MTAKLYLLTGGAGHLGRALSKALVDQGKRVRILALDGEKNIPPGVEVVYGDLRDLASLRPFFAHQPEEDLYLVHAGGIVTISSSDKREVYEVNVGGTQNILDMSFKNKVKRLVYISSVHALPEVAWGWQVKESLDFDPDKLVGLYAKTKAQASRLVLSAARKGLNASLVHPSGIVGPYDKGTGHTTGLILDYVQGRLFSMVKGGYDFVDVRDVAQAVIKLSQKEGRGDNYILSGHYLTLKDFFDLLAQLSGKRPLSLVLPAWLVRLVAPLAQGYYALRKKPPLFTAYSLYTLSTNAHFSHERASRHLAYAPRPFRQTLIDTLAWLELEGRLRRH